MRRLTYQERREVLAKQQDEAKQRLTARKKRQRIEELRFGTHAVERVDEIIARQDSDPDYLDWISELRSAHEGEVTRQAEVLAAHRSDLVRRLLRNVHARTVRWIGIAEVAGRMSTTIDCLESVIVELKIPVEDLQLSEGGLVFRVIPETYVDELPPPTPRAQVTRRRRGPMPRPEVAAKPLVRFASRLRPNLCGLYVIRCSASGRYKIGKSTNVAARLRGHASSLQSDRMIGPFECLRVISCSPTQLDWLELVLHHVYDDHREDRQEIFEAGLLPPPESLKTAADVLALFRSRGEAIILAACTKTRSA